MGSFNVEILQGRIMPHQSAYYGSTSSGLRNRLMWSYYIERLGAAVWLVALSCCLLCWYCFFFVIQLKTLILLLNRKQNDRKNSMCNLQYEKQ